MQEDGQVHKGRIGDVRRSPDKISYCHEALVALFYDKAERKLFVRSFVRSFGITGTSRTGLFLISAIPFVWIFFVKLRGFWVVDPF